MCKKLFPRDEFLQIVLARGSVYAKIAHSTVGASYLCINLAELAQVPSGNFNDDIIQARLKASCCRVGD